MSPQLLSSSSWPSPCLPSSAANRAVRDSAAAAQLTREGSGDWLRHWRGSSGSGSSSSKSRYTDSESYHYGSASPPSSQLHQQHLQQYLQHAGSPSYVQRYHQDSPSHCPSVAGAVQRQQRFVSSIDLSHGRRVLLRSVSEAVSPHVTQSIDRRSCQRSTSEPPHLAER